MEMEKNNGEGMMGVGRAENGAQKILEDKMTNLSETKNQEEEMKEEKELTDRTIGSAINVEGDRIAARSAQKNQEEEMKVAAGGRLVEKDAQKTLDNNKLAETSNTSKIMTEKGTNVMTDEKVEQSLSEKINNTPKTFKEDRPKYILLEKTKALYTMLHSYLELFPKSEKFTLRQKTEESVLEGIRLLILQNYQQTDIDRKRLILSFLSEIYIIEVLLQQAVIFKYLSYGGYEKLMPLVREINAFTLARYRNLNAANSNVGVHEVTGGLIKNEEGCNENI